MGYCVTCLTDCDDCRPDLFRKGRDCVADCDVYGMTAELVENEDYYICVASNENEIPADKEPTVYETGELGIVWDSKDKDGTK